MLRLVGLLACAAASVADSEGEICSGAACALDHVGLLQLRRTSLAQDAVQCSELEPPLDIVSVCPIGNTASRCNFFVPFSAGGLGLMGGVGEVAHCLNVTHGTPVNETCFVNNDFRLNFEVYANNSYAQNGGTHAAFIWGANDVPATYSVQPDLTTIADYYWKFIGRHSLGFDFPTSLYPEPLNGFQASEDKGCAVVNEAPSTKPSYIFFGFHSLEVAYAGGLAILDKDGKILRQYATASGWNFAQQEAPGYKQDYPTTFGEKGRKGKIATALTKYWYHLTKTGSKKELAKLYAKDAKVSVFSYLDGQSLTVFHGRKAIKNYLKQLFQHFGGIWGLPMARTRSYLKLAEEPTPSVPGNGHYTYMVGDGQMGISLVFDSDGLIYGEGVFAAVEGLQLLPWDPLR